MDLGGIWVIGYINNIYRRYPYLNLSKSLSYWPPRTLIRTMYGSAGGFTPNPY